MTRAYYSLLRPVYGFYKGVHFPYYIYFDGDHIMVLLYAHTHVREVGSPTFRINSNPILMYIFLFARVKC